LRADRHLERKERELPRAFAWASGVRDGSEEALLLDVCGFAHVDLSILSIDFIVLTGIKCVFSFS